MSSVLQILLIDDDRDDYLLTRDLLREALPQLHNLEWAANYEAGRRVLMEFRHDVYLLDYRLGARTGLDLLREAIERNCDAPLILLTGEGQREIDMAAMEAGAADYLTKADLTAATLERSIRFSLERCRNRRVLEQMNQLLETRVYERTCELERANRELRMADARKDEFLATLAHELRNPLAPISSALALLDVSDGNSETALQARQTMQRQLAQMVRLIDDLLEISRISRGKFELRKTQVELSEILRQAIEASQPLFDTKQQRLIVDQPTQAIVLEADPARLAQVIGNLLNNASKFSHPQGQIRLRVVENLPECNCDTKADSADSLEEQSDTHQSFVRIFVEDDGIGIEQNQLDRIFEMFTQVDQSLERAQGGLGIGLTLVKSLVEFHGGRIVAQSDGIGRGSRFVVTLPRLPRTIVPATEKAARPKAMSPSGKRILVVDDNRDSASLLAMLLRTARNEVYLAFDGLEAVDVARRHLPDVVLLDIGMPKQNGYETARQIRQLSNDKPMLLVAMTGWGQMEDRKRSKEAGFDYHLVKPIDIALLGDILHGPAQPAKQ